MATVTVTVPDAYAQETANAVWDLCPPPAPPGVQPQITKADNVARVLKWHLKSLVLEARRRAAAATADLTTVETDMA